ncbi:hypothetical protein [Ureibacillus acetophenoni]|uniref:Lipoprotein n=1 Tax=Ureibacillus acetophenoni TaxID=614649 RepID=A0A285USP1_9BACL|nr:hypothetical protein [Ureibacillus acetophenoni]SOC43716.1 hypothetical protein SAMN05877842_11723 [Ureibacillus acetophenoni]
MFKRALLSAISLLLVSITLVGCSSSSNGSYQGILSVNGEKYFLRGEMKDAEFTLGEKLGKVQKKVNPKINPNEHLSSNYLEIGEEIYTSNEDSEVLIVKRENGELEIMVNESYYNIEEGN